MSDSHRNYLHDVGYDLRLQAIEAMRNARDAAGTPAEAFQKGRSMAYYEVLSYLISQAAAFDVPLDDLRLEGFDPDRELLS